MRDNDSYVGLRVRTGVERGGRDNQLTNQEKRRLVLRSTTDYSAGAATAASRSPPRWSRLHAAYKSAATS